MKGSYQIVVSNKRVKYDFTVNRNITVIQGDSATGKTTLIKLISDYYDEGIASGVKLECKKKCVVLQGKDWQYKLEKIRNSIVFIDEGSKFITSNDFARMVKESDNYYVIITREDLHALPYSVNEIYGIQQIGKTKTSEPVYNEMYRLYGEFAATNTIQPSVVITEDSNAGHDFFNTVCNSKNMKCISAKGKSNIVKYIVDRPEETILIIADGAAFGPEMRKVMQYIKQYPNYVIYLPESFEWLILKSGLFKTNDLQKILDSPGDYIESEEFFSWERYFTSLLEDITAHSSFVEQYSKNGKLVKFYKVQGNVDKVLGQIKKINF